MLQLLPDEAELAFQMCLLRQRIDRAELEFSRLAADLADSGLWERSGFNSAIDWIRFNCMMTSNAAADRIAVGVNSARLKESVQAMEQ
ncbi:MAG TPA: hypothetical protein VJT78_03325, partial [Candidatus Dormibacteraeota bacterium]|nr:hypothetical protein [Candidatus Dormibacteraeota bacterium]